MELLIREAGLEDLRAILSLQAALAYEGESGLAEAEAKEIFARIQQYPDYRVYVATAQGKVIGSFSLLIMDNLAHRGAPSGIVEDVVVDPAWQGQGVGREMIRYAMDRCREKGCYKLVLSSNLQREAAHRFYQSLGFEQHGLSFQISVFSRFAP